MLDIFKNNEGSNRNNSYDLLRLILAGFVLISHSFYLQQKDYTDIGYLLNNQTYLGEIGLFGFFSLSGYLVSESFIRNANVFKFLSNRILRIFPGFWTCLGVTAFIIAPVIYYFEKGAFAGYAYNGSWGGVNYIRKNFLLTINQPNIRSVLDTFDIKNLNGSLWTLRYEFICYLITMGLGLMALLKKRSSFVILFSILFVMYIAIHEKLIISDNSFLSYSFFKLLIAYFTGILFLNYKNELFKYKKLVVYTLLAITVILGLLNKLTIFLPISLGLTLLLLFGSFTIRLKNDYSYGLYIYAYPIQLVLIIYAPDMYLVPYILLSILITLLFASISYHLVEKPAMRLKRRINFRQFTFEL